MLLLPFTEGCAVQDRARDMLGLVAETHCLKCAFYREIQGMLSKSISDMATLNKIYIGNPSHAP